MQLNTSTVLVVVMLLLSERLDLQQNELHGENEFYVTGGQPLEQAAALCNLWLKVLCFSMMQTGITAKTLGFGVIARRVLNLIDTRNHMPRNAVILR